jgi:glycosyltransferase involved in cell wall biosynthesis
LPNVLHIHINPGFANRLHNELIKAGIDSNILTLTADGQSNKKITKIGRKGRLTKWIEDKIQNYLTRKNKKEFGLFTFPILGNNLVQNEKVKNADIFYLHWVLGGLMNFSGIEQIVRLGKPVVFYMHDMWYMTGGCHYNFTCEKYKSHCSECQISKMPKEKDYSFKGFERKKAIFSRYHNLYFISPSQWLYECAKQSALLKNKPIFHIPNFLDSNTFKSFDKVVAKQILNIPSTQIIIGFGAEALNSPYKGWSYLMEALADLFESQYSANITILIFGSANETEISESIPFKTISMGYLKDEYSKVLTYNAMDVFIAPSLADNLPYTIYEALSSGTPVVSFDIGGIPDLIRHKENGYLAKYKDSKDISAGIKFCLDNKIKGYRLPEFETGSIIKKHLALFEYLDSNNQAFDRQPTLDNSTTTSITDRMSS